MQPLRPPLLMNQRTNRRRGPRSRAGIPSPHMRTRWTKRRRMIELLPTCVDRTCHAAKLRTRAPLMGMMLADTGMLQQVSIARRWRNMTHWKNDKKYPAGKPHFRVVERAKESCWMFFRHLTTKPTPSLTTTVLFVFWNGDGWLRLLGLTPTSMGHRQSRRPIIQSRRVVAVRLEAGKNELESHDLIRRRSSRRFWGTQSCPRRPVGLPRVRFLRRKQESCP